MDKIRFDYSKAIKFINMHEVNHMEETVKYMHRMLHDRTGLGNDFLGWVEHPVNYDREEFLRIKKAAEKLNDPML